MRSLLPLLVLTGCTSSHGPADPGAPLASLAPTRRLAELSDAEAAQACADIERYRTQRVSDAEDARATCLGVALQAVVKAGAASDAAARAACADELARCLAAPPPRDAGGCATHNVVVTLGRCKVLTVADLSGCIVEMQDNKRALIGQDVCAGLEAKRLPAALLRFTQLATGPRCLAMTAPCKDL
jgi:hypothetical protein